MQNKDIYIYLSTVAVGLDAKQIKTAMANTSTESLCRNFTCFNFENIEIGPHRIDDKHKEQYFGDYGRRWKHAHFCEHQAVPYCSDLIIPTRAVDV